jgi:hypothetical protein
LSANPDVVEKLTFVSSLPAANDVAITMMITWVATLGMSLLMDGAQVQNNYSFFVFRSLTIADHRHCAPDRQRLWLSSEPIIFTTLILTKPNKNSPIPMLLLPFWTYSILISSSFFDR